jgi:hypothetical protein
MKRVLFFLSGLMGFSMYSQVQTPDGETFRPVLTAGIVASQVDGDTYAGYTKPGYYLGVGINRAISKKVELEFALTFLQKGARKNYSLDSASRNNPNNEFYLLRLNYVEIPAGIKYNLKKFKAEAGGAFAYLIKNPPFEESQNGYFNINGFSNFDYSYYLGMGYKLKDNLLVNIRFEYSFISIRKYYTSGTGIYHGQFPYNLFNLGMYNNLLVLSLNYKLPAVQATPNGQ